MGSDEELVDEVPCCLRAEGEDKASRPESEDKDEKRKENLRVLVREPSDAFVQARVAGDDVDRDHGADYGDPHCFSGGQAREDLDAAADLHGADSKHRCDASCDRQQADAVDDGSRKAIDTFPRDRVERGADFVGKVHVVDGA